MKKFLLTAAFVFVGSIAFAQERIAVFPFEILDNAVTLNQSYQLYDNFTNRFATMGAGRFIVVPRQDVEKLINMEADFQLSDFSARAKTADMQRVLNGTQILTGKIGKVENRINISVSLYTYPDLRKLPGGADLRVSDVNELFDSIPYLLRSMQNVIANAVITPGGYETADGQPNWIRIPLNGRAKFETGSSGVSTWYYDVGQSNRTTTEQLARTRARENVQQMIAANIASNMKNRIDITSNSMFDLSDIEETQNRIQTTLTNSISTKVPSYEVLEWYIEKGNESGRNWYRAHVLVRFIRQDIFKNVESINVQNIADSVIRSMRLTPTDYERAALIRELEGARDFSLGPIRDGSEGR
jgi:hypothetical protein